ncbi:MAG: OmpA family protein [bacterium]|nr:OmpA family protein [bacterium]
MSYPHFNSQIKSLTNLISLTFLLCFQIAIADKNPETAEEKFKRADKIFSGIYENKKTDEKTRYKGGYLEARKIFLQLYAKDTTNKNLAFKIGVCYQGSNKYGVDAIPYLLSASKSITTNYKGSSYKERGAPAVSLKFLGDAYHLNYQFDKALAAYSEYKAQLLKIGNSDSSLVRETDRKIDMCNNGKIYVAAPIKITIENLGPALNSPYADYSPVITADQNSLYFTTRRPSQKSKEKNDDGNYWEDIFVSHKTVNGWSAAKSIGPSINSDGNEASISVSPDGQSILIYSDYEDSGNLYSTRLDGDEWTAPIKLGKNINSEYWEPSACLTANGSVIYFVSDRPGGYGGRDIYSSSRQPDSTWGVAVNMGPKINTAYEEDAPFIHADGRTLSFSSNGHTTMGGFDIFTSLLSEDNVWSDPINVGYPLNTTDDDVFYVVSPDGMKAYFTSFRKEGLGEKDNYVVTFLDRKKTPLTLVKGTVTDQSGKPAQEVIITVTDNETEQVVGTYKTNSKTGEFLFILTPGKNYNITYNAKDHLFYSENIEIPKESNYYEINRAIAMTPIVVGSKINLNNIFFDFDKATLRSLSNVELKNLVQLMKSNSNLKVEIAGHTDNKGYEKYNQVLSEDRAQAVVNRLIEKGIDASRMKAKGYGKTMPVADNEKANGEDDPEGRQLNRRVELRITEIN